MARTITVHLLDETGTPHTLALRPGRSLMREATAAGIEGIAADCGGCMTCATCHVVVDAAWATQLAPPSADEHAMLDMTAVPRSTTSRLSCQLLLGPEHDGLRVTLPERQY